MKNPTLFPEEPQFLLTLGGNRLYALICLDNGSNASIYPIGTYRNIQELICRRLSPKSCGQLPTKAMNNIINAVTIYLTSVAKRLAIFQSLRNRENTS
jgi:hypothetical protein